jgi:ankyrin repeat protein
VAWSLIEGLQQDRQPGLHGNTLLHCAALHGHAPTLARLLAAGVDVNAANIC